MVLIKECNIITSVLGLFPEHAKETDLKENASNVSEFYSTCGFLALFPKQAERKDIPEDFKFPCWEPGFFSHVNYAQKGPSGKCEFVSCNIRDDTIWCPVTINPVCADSKLFLNKCAAQQNCVFDANAAKCADLAVGNEDDLATSGGPSVSNGNGGSLNSLSQVGGNNEEFMIM